MEPQMADHVMISQARFARAVGVTRMAITLAVQSGRLQAYDAVGRRVSSTFRGRKFLKLDEAVRDWDGNRVRFDDNYFARGGR